MHTMSSPVEEFWELCKKASEAWERSYETREYEPCLLRILNHVKTHNDYEEEFKKAFIQIIEQPDSQVAIWEIVMYCMRELRWQEVYDAAYKRYSTHKDPRVTSVMEDILAVFNDDWQDSEWFEYYS